MDLYFSHMSLEDLEEPDLRAGLHEVIQLTARARDESHGMRFYEMLWETALRDGRSLREYLYGLPNTDDLKGVLPYINQGPYYRNQGLRKELVIDPEVPSGSFQETLLHACCIDQQQFILSRTCEHKLQSDSYILQEGECTSEVYNLRGLGALGAHLDGLRKFNRIGDVFQELDNGRWPGIRILRDAERSARGHNFLNHLHLVFKALTALEEVELVHVLREDVPETERIRLFRQATGLRISKESPTTMADPYFRRQREFVVDGERRLFEWHVKIGNHTRIHYYVDKPNRVLHVGHCGPHLGIPTYDS